MSRRSKTNRSTDVGYSDELAKLIGAADRAWAVRMAHLTETAGGRADAARRVRAAELLDCMLVNDVRGPSARSAYFSRLAGRLQLACGSVRSLSTCLAVPTLTPRRARALATALAELFHFADAAADEGSAIDLYLVMKTDRGRLVVGLAVEGACAAVARFEATRCLVRARDIIDAIGGDFARGFQDGRMVIGITIRLRATELGAGGLVGDPE